MRNKYIILLLLLSALNLKAAENVATEASLPTDTQGVCEAALPPTTVARPTLLQLKGPHGENPKSYTYEYDHHEQLSPDMLQKMIQKGYEALAAIYEGTIDQFPHALEVFAGDLSKYNNRWFANGFHLGFGTEYFLKKTWYSYDRIKLVEEYNKKRLAQLETLICVIWALTDHAFKIGEGFKRGSFSIIDPDLKLLKYLEKFSILSADYPKEPTPKTPDPALPASSQEDTQTDDTSLKPYAVEPSLKQPDESPQEEDPQTNPTTPLKRHENLSAASESSLSIKTMESDLSLPPENYKNSSPLPPDPTPENFQDKLQVSQETQAPPINIKTDGETTESEPQDQDEEHESLTLSIDSDDDGTSGKKIEADVDNLSPALFNILGSNFVYRRDSKTSHYVGLSEFQIGIDIRFDSASFPLQLLPFKMTHILWGAVRTQLGKKKTFVKFEEYGLGDNRSAFLHSLNFSANTKGIDEQPDVRREKAIREPIADAAGKFFEQLHQEQTNWDRHKWILDHINQYLYKGKPKGFFQDSSKIDLACLYKLCQSTLKSSSASDELKPLAQELSNKILEFYDKETIKFRTGNEVVLPLDCFKKQEN